MNPARVQVLLLAACGLMWVGCNDPASPRTPPPAAALAESTAAGLRDWVVNPPVVASEREAGPRRLVCAAPSVTEICCALGLQRRIVARTRFCDYPPGIETVPAIGAMDETNTELLLGLKPDLVLVSGTSRAITERLERMGLTFESLPDRTLADVFAAIERVGELTERRETARRLSDGLRAELTRIARQYADVPPQRVLVLLWTLSDPPAPPFVAGPDSLYDDLLRRAGHANVADAGVQAYAPFSLEAIVRADPDVIIELDADGTGRPGGDTEAVRVWSQLGPLRAVKNRRVHVLKGERHFIPGPRIVQTFAELCRAVAGSPHE